jgi:hypothetical protein
MVITPREGMNQSKIILFIVEIDLVSSHFSQPLTQVSDDTTSPVTMQEYRLI